MTETTATSRVWPDFPRSSGILLHPTSFPGPYGVGEIGPMAHEFVDFLADAQQNPAVIKLDKPVIAELVGAGFIGYDLWFFPTAAAVF